MENFMRDYRRILIQNFQKIRIEGGGEYWTCGQEHDPRNWNQEPWNHLERQKGKSFLNSWKGNWNASARFYLMRGNCGKALRWQFGVDFDRGEVGLLDCDRNCRSVFRDNAKWFASPCTPKGLA
jgi:hypothetical protein